MGPVLSKVLHVLSLIPKPTYLVVIGIKFVPILGDRHGDTERRVLHPVDDVISIGKRDGSCSGGCG